MKFSEYFKLGLKQAQLDFVDVDPQVDTKLYVDPYALEIKRDAWSTDCGDDIRSYFQELLDNIRAGNDDRCQHLISHLHEPEETYLGESSGLPQGHGVGSEQGNQILQKLKESRAVETGLLTDLAESALFIKYIDKDKISDLTTNIIRGKLLEYTAGQCALHNIPNLRPYGGPPIWNRATMDWEARQGMIPYVEERPVILVPKYAVRRRLSLNSQEFYNHQIEFFQAEYTRANAGLVRMLRGHAITKKALKERYPYSKQALADFAIRHPQVLEMYKEIKGARGPLDLNDFEKDFDERAFARILRVELKKIPAGRDAANRYHNFTMGALTFLLYPSLICSVKEAEINQGRKRLDIRYTNAAISPFFHRILSAPQTRALTVVVECKNYTDDIGNEELDQLAGRFNDVRGWFGMILCRAVDDEPKLLARCLDLARDRHGFIIPITDDDLDNMLSFVESGDRRPIDGFLSGKLDRLFS